MSFMQSIGSEIKKSAASKIAGAVVGTATLAATGATISYFAKSNSADQPVPAEVTAADATAALSASLKQDGTPAAPDMPKMTPPPAGGSPAPTPAAAPVGGGVVVEYQQDYGTGAGSDMKDAKDLALDFLNEKGWVEGINPNGMIVVVGKASLDCGAENAGFDGCRRRAYMNAMFVAKKRLAEFLALQVASSVKSAYAEGDIVKQLAQARARQASGTPGFGDKVLLLANAYVEKELKDMNVDFGQAQTAQNEAERQKAIEMARKEADQLQSISEFSSAVQTAAMAEVSALQAYRTFEYIPAGGKGGIAVVAVYSERSGKLHQALLGRGEAPTGAPKEAISAWAKSKGAEALMYTFGTQPRMNENGELVLVAFGQSTPIGGSERQMDAAEEKAVKSAQQAARQFMGEMVMSQDLMSEAATLKELADGSSVYKDESSFAEKLEAEAQSLSMPGGLPRHRWKFKHPLSNKVTVGVVMEFSVSGAIAANSLRERFKAAGGAAGGAGISTKRPPAAPVGTAPRAPDAPGKSRTGNTGNGAEGDEP